MSEHLGLGAVVPALFVDGVEDTPWVVGTLTLTDAGVRVALPYVTQVQQFETVSKWIDGETPPPNLLVESKDLRISLFGLRYHGHTHRLVTGTAEGLIDVEEAVIASRGGSLQDPLLVEKVKSEIDGLIEWSGLSSVSFASTRTGEGMDLRNTVTYTVQSADGLSWTQGDATLTISTSWAGNHGQGIRVDDRGVLISTFPEPRPFRDHLVEQRKFVAFLSVMFGTSISFRKHEIQDARFPTQSIEGTVHGYPYVELISRQTVREYVGDKPSKDHLRFPLTAMQCLSSATLTKWGEGYDSWARFLLPVVGVLRVRNLVVENMAINAAMSLEAFGKTIVTLAEGEEETYRNDRPTTATYIYRGTKALGLKWDSIAASEVGLARAIAQNYNSIKHPGNQEFPDGFHTRTLAQISMGVVRLNALKLVASEKEYSQVDASQVFREPLELFKLNDLFIDAEGKIVERPAVPPVDTNSTST
ncbi:hypothetical protein [Paenarthrobacter sp. 2TAF44]|uniref:ApeA N-terminal domain 1-containing protein n=1 Tax=Paenarthrobacter sp. 2TAF44 TaxID=3233018 RepID=UPI003F9A15A3